MKKIVALLSAYLLICLMGFGQQIKPDKVPAKVKKAFSQMFPSATDVSYEMEKAEYEITFKDKGIEKSANFDSTGKWHVTEIEITESDLPNEIFVSVVKNFPGFKISEVSKIDTPERGVGYEMDLKKDKEDYEVQFSPKGDVLKKTPLKKEN